MRCGVGTVHVRILTLIAEVESALVFSFYCRIFALNVTFNGDPEMRAVIPENRK